MFIKLFLLSLVLTALIMVTLGIKLLFDRKAEFTVHSCSTGAGDTNGTDGCHSCQMVEMTDCPEKKTV
ncbi:MAG: hypothetical protein GXO83_00415 [Chlorobi bacterium]|nr:hypothetical protein [Chlorobiota bacterium]